MRAKKGQLSIGSLLPIGITFVVLAIALGLGATVLTSVQDTQATNNAGTHCGLNSTGGTGGTLLYDGCGYSYNISGFGLNSVDEVSSWMPTVALVVVAVVIIGLVMLFMRNRG